MNIRILRTVGLILFIAGFALFNSSFFLSGFQLSKEILLLETGVEKADLLERYNPELLKKYYSSNFSFISDLEGSFTKVNNEVVSVYGIQASEIHKIIELQLGNAFSIEDLNRVFDTETAIGVYKIQKVKDYGSWLEGREFNNSEELESNLRVVAENIQKYSILQEKGFDRYQIKDLKYRLTSAAAVTPIKEHPGLFLFLTYLLCITGAAFYLLPQTRNSLPGIKNNGIFFNPMKNTGWLGILTGAYLIGFYIFLYYFPEYMTSWILMVDPISFALKGSPAGRFFLYGFIYTLCILVMGVRMLIKYRHSKYQMIRTFSVMFFQTAFAFLIPEILVRLNKPYFDFKNIWPLDYDFFFGNELDKLIDGGGLGIFMLGWGIGLILIGVPVFVYFFGKRWYCSWVCGCGGLAETLGDPYRQLSNKKISAWKVERWMIHSVLVFAVVMTASVLYTYWTGNSEFLGMNSYKIREIYGAWIGAGFAGVIGTGFYPLMGNRVWCRFGCPLAAYLGLVQRFKSRFRITTNGGQCISCGNCSTYCEMGIDVRWYAQRGQNIVRSSCVGCGVCSSVCPRGVLNLENKDEAGRFGNPILIGNDSFKVVE